MNIILKKFRKLSKTNTKYNKLYIMNIYMIYMNEISIVNYYFIIYFSSSERIVFFFRAVEKSHSVKPMLFNHEDLDC